MHVAYSVKKSHGEVAKCERKKKQKKKQFVVYMFSGESEEDGASRRFAGSLTRGDDVCYFWYP